MPSTKRERPKTPTYCATATSFLVDLFGRTGEPKADRQIHFAIKHHDFREQVRVTLKTDEAGRIRLGPLLDVEWLRATGP